MEEVHLKVTRMALIYNPPILVVEYLKQNKEKNKLRNNSDMDYGKEKDAEEVLHKSSKVYHKKIKFKTNFLTHGGNNAETVTKKLINHIPSLLNGQHHQQQVCQNKILVQLIQKLISKCHDYHSCEESKHTKISNDQNYNEIVVKESVQQIKDDNDSDENIPPLQEEMPSSLSSKNLDAISSNDQSFDDESMVGNDHDLNKVSDECLKRVKEKMNVVFNAKRILPGEEGYEYDKRVDYETPLSESSWDD